jgi:hypothetical protein
MDIIFEITDKQGKKIRLTKTQWSHIKTRHPGVSEFEIQETIKNPLKIIEEDNNVIIFYRFYKENHEKYLKWRWLCNNILLCKKYALK